MIPIQSVALIYAGMLLENPKRREQLTKFLNGAGTEVEKMVNNFTSKGGVVNNETAATEESTEFR